MSRKEAIKVLKEYLALDKDIDNEYLEAQKVAIKAMEQEPCEDCISREKAKQFLYERIDRLNDDELYDIFSRIIDDMYNELPSATPTQRWIPVGDPKESGKYLVTFGGTHLIGIDFYHTEEDTRKIFEKPEEEDIGWRSHNVVAWMPLPKPYKVESEVEECQ